MKQLIAVFIVGIINFHPNGVTGAELSAKTCFAFCTTSIRVTNYSNAEYWEGLLPTLAFHTLDSGGIDSNIGRNKDLKFITRIDNFAAKFPNAVHFGTRPERISKKYIAVDAFNSGFGVARVNT